MATARWLASLPPFYNEEEFLGECISSVLAQEYANFEYILVDNRSSDRSLEIAREFASQDDRIRVCENEEHLSQVENFNNALHLISTDSAFTKIVQGDDWLYPDCVSKMVGLASEDSSIGVVSSYVLLGWEKHASVYLDGLPVTSKILDGADVCRRFIEEGLYLFGSPSVTLIRSDLIRARRSFYPDSSVVEDVEVFFEILRNHSVGFVHQVLSYTRRDNSSTISPFRNFDLMLLTRKIIAHKYGRQFLDDADFEMALSETNRRYYDALGLAVFKFVPREYWSFHSRGLAGIGMHIEWWFLLGGAVRSLLDLMLNPKNTVGNLIRRLRH